MNQDTFIIEIKIKKVRHLEDFSISLGKEKKHLILTGKNGSGKTSVLENIHQKFIHLYKNNTAESFLNIVFNDRDFRDKTKEDFIYAYLIDKRRDKKMLEPKGAKKLELSKDKLEKLNDNFLQYLVNLKIDLLFAKVENETENIQALEKWFCDFENMMKQIFDDSFKITLDRTDYTFWIERDNREPFTFNTLSAGYWAIIDIVSEIIMKISTTTSKSFDCHGIVLIDELETHLHVELQKDIFPMLTRFFPNIQFIVTTHSPFVLSSLENSVIYDLERKEQVSGERLYIASYKDIVKNYFEVDNEASQILEDMLSKYENLTNLFVDNILSIENERELVNLELKLDEVASMMTENNYLRFKEAQDRISEDD
ncbi:ATP binding protein [hydrothermal vent metagenome]|uniref:ATP binding protein n=1 Tax=hydrothermal vent metagenome TaxID=652676 RepID=A0A1W1CZY2_9ZZZZ